MRNFTIYGKDGCPFCKLALDHLIKEGHSFEFKNTVSSEVKSELLARYPEAKQVPQIFEGTTHVGGYDKLSAYLNKA